jgi:hypothetical protein
VFENAQRAEKEFRETGCGLLCAYIRLNRGPDFEVR